MHSDTTHEPGRHLHWSEEFYFNLYDRARNVCGFMRIGLRPSQSLKEMVCHFMMPDGSVVGLREVVPLDRPDLFAKGLRLEMMEPERTWDLKFAGGMERTTERKAKKSHVEFDLRFEALNDMFDYRSCVSARDEEPPGTIAFEHLEQFGRLKGVLSTGLDDFKIDALGERSHSWGVRDWAATRGWAWLTCQFSESHALNLTRLVTDEGVIDAGFVFLDGKNIAVLGADLNINKDFAKNPMSFDMTLRDGEGGSHKVFGSVLKRMILQNKSPDGNTTSYMNETLTRYNTSGKNGYGVAEFLTGTE